MFWSFFLTIQELKSKLCLFWSELHLKNTPFTSLVYTPCLSASYNVRRIHGATPCIPEQSTVPRVASYTFNPLLFVAFLTPISNSSHIQVWQKLVLLLYLPSLHITRKIHLYMVLFLLNKAHLLKSDLSKLEMEIE